MLPNYFQFWSDQFGPLQSETDENNDDYINPGMWARQLSDFLSKEMEKLGWKTVFVAVEDWGHYIALSSTPDGKENANICCSNVDSEIVKDRLESYLVYGQPDVKIVKRWLKKIDVSEVSQKLGDDLHTILSSCNKCVDLRRGVQTELPI